MIPKSSGRRPAISSPRSQRPRLVHWMLADYHHSSGANASAHDRFPDQHLKISARVRCLQVSSSRSPKSHVCSTALPSLSAGARNLPSSSAKLNRRHHQPQPDPSTSAAIVPPKAAFARTAVTSGGSPDGNKNNKAGKTSPTASSSHGLALWSGHSSSKLRMAHSRRAGIPAWVFAHRKS